MWLLIINEPNLSASNDGINNISTKNLEIKEFCKCFGRFLYLFFINIDIILHIILIESGTKCLHFNKSSKKILINRIAFLKLF